MKRSPSIPLAEGILPGYKIFRQSARNGWVFRDPAGEIHIVADGCTHRRCVTAAREHAKQNPQMRPTLQAHQERTVGLSISVQLHERLERIASSMKLSATELAERLLDEGLLREEPKQSDLLPAAMVL